MMKKLGAGDGSPSGPITDLSKDENLKDSSNEDEKDSKDDSEETD